MLTMTATTSATRPDRLPFTGDDEADRLLVSDPFALLVGFVLDQQITVQKAFSGPMEIRRRLGHLDPTRISRTDPAELDRVFRERPAIHRFPGNMARQVQALATAVATSYGGEAGRIWREARDGAELESRLRELPSIGEMKSKTILAVLARRFGVELPGLSERLPQHPTLGDVDSADALARYQEGKRAHKAAMRASGKRP
jgi:uncharacterized HhH-GPD family protein